MTDQQEFENNLLMHNLCNDGWTNLTEWDEKIVNELCEQQEIEAITSFDDVTKFFHDDLHESFLSTISTLLFKFLIDKGVANIVEPRPLHIEPNFYTGLERLRNWEKIIKNQEWKQYIKKLAPVKPPSLTKNKSGQWLGGGDCP